MSFLGWSEFHPNLAVSLPAKQAVPTTPAMSAPTSTPYEPGYLVAGKYELEIQLGQGGMGVVWRARNVALDSPVAIKVVRATTDRARLSERLIQEARAAAKLAHPAIVKVFDVGQTESGDPFIVMELLRGESLGKLLETGGRLPAVQAVRSLLPVIDALWLAHTKGIVHRDLKPDNVFIVQYDGAIQPTLVDFGIVKVQSADAESHLTKAGDLLGSPDYMSPEQARGQDDVNHLTDVWSVCVVLYEIITGHTPFKGNNYNALLRQIVEGTPPTLRELSAADDELSAIVMRGLSKQAEQRFASMGELGRALAGWLVQQGVTEDICGSTLETKWLRGTDPQGRAGRATLTSITDVWPGEAGSGVRRNGLGPIHTVPAPPLPLPGPRPMRMVLVGAVGLLALALLGFALGRRLSWSPAAAPAAAVQGQVAATPAGSALVVSTTSLGGPNVPPSSAVDEKPAQSAGVSVSSGLGHASGAAHGARPTRVPPAKRGAGPGKSTTLPGDLISPY